jgi:signal transduction histidine kinase
MVHLEKPMLKHQPDTWAPPSWPVLLAFGLVAVLIFGMFGVDLLLGQRVAVNTDDMVDNAVRSNEVLDDLRTHVWRLGAASRADGELEGLRRAIEADARDYDPLATYPGEREEWTKLEELVHKQLDSALANPHARPPLDEQIAPSIRRLVAINHAGARANAAMIRAAHRAANWADVITGTLALALVSLIAGRSLRVLSRQRRLVAERVHAMDEKNRELEAFAGRAAHDLRSPMNPIRGYADLILEGKGSPEEVAGMAQRIRRAVDRMTRVVDDMLALSIAGRPAPGRCSTAEVIAAVIEEMGPDLHEVAVVTELAGGAVTCQDGVLGQLLRNLIGNAIKFREHSRPLKITVSTKDVGLMVELVVRDNGVGMDPESAKHAFEPFYRAPMGREVPGHGLGLAIVERTTRALGGTTELSSAPDGGTRIALRLPRA